MREMVDGRKKAKGAAKQQAVLVQSANLKFDVNWHLTVVELFCNTDLYL